MSERWIGMRANENIPYALVIKSSMYVQTFISLVISFARYVSK